MCELPLATRESRRRRPRSAAGGMGGAQPPPKKTSTVARNPACHAGGVARWVAGAAPRYAESPCYRAVLTEVYMESLSLVAHIPASPEAVFD